MAFLIKCPTCGNDVSSEAEACPKCGHMINKRTTPIQVQTKGGGGCGGVFTIAFGIIVAVIIISFF